MKAWLRSFHIVGAIAAALAIASFFFARSLSDETRKWLVVAWIVLPPVYFFVELHWVRKWHPDRLDDCQMSQDSAAKIWLAVIAALTLLYLNP